MTLRSLLFVPGDRPDRFAKAAASGADALILDLEDAVAPDRKAEARKAIADALPGATVPMFVRVNPLDSSFHADDIAAIAGLPIAGVLLPKAEGAADVRRLAAELPGVPILPIATETPKAIFALGSYGEVAEHLIGLTWGAEDLPAAIGATTSRDENGDYHAPYQLARSLTLFAAHAAGVPAIETVSPDFRDLQRLEIYARAGFRDGFSGMMAIHPAQVPVINASFSPSPEQIEAARRVVDAFAADPAAGALQIDGKMIDAPHLKAAQRLLAGISE
ncbi:Citryl-CoA lyase [Sphingomonas antarctica]|uniref:HpcH/HpaI aldolase/citrate lyase family protein n=1 Tax=Sphingomonas antarctica TaxID=2040274 RepID=UPI0039EA5EEB